MTPQFNNPLVSICIPCYNSEQHIGETIKSLINQTYKNIEIIIVDDGSSDKSTEKIRAFSDNRIKFYKQLNKGAGAARNLAFHYSTGDYIKFMDADDLINSDAIASQIGLANQFPGNVISGKWGRFYNNDIKTFSINPESVWRRMSGVEWITESWERGPNMTQPGIFLIPRFMVEQSGGWNEKLSRGPMDDMEFFTKIIVGSQEIIFCEKSILYYRSGLKNSLSKIKDHKAIEIALETLLLSIEHLTKASSYNENIKKACSVQLQIFRYNTYLMFSDLYKKATAIQKAYGKNEYCFPCGKITNVLTQIFGWKIAKRVRLFFD